MKKTKVNRFNIDFYEFSFLVEACIPPVPIARSMFWDDVINKYYHELSVDERAKLHEWIMRNPRFDNNNEQCLLFNVRFDPNNQYKVKTLYNGAETVYECFKLNNRYYTKVNTSISDEYILDVEKI